MGHRIRIYEPGIVFASTQGTVDRRFMFKPNHRPDNRLLHYSCDADALDPRNDKIPIPSTINIIGSSLGRAQEQVDGVFVHEWESNVNHVHTTTSCELGCEEQVAALYRMSNSMTARGLNRLYEREGPVFASRARVTPALRDEDAEQQFLYGLCNPVKDGLIEVVRDSPFFSSYSNHAFGEEASYWHVDWTAYHNNGGSRNRNHCPKDYITWTTPKFAPLPHQADWEEHRRQTWVRKQVQEIEKEAEAERRKSGRVVIGVPELYGRSWEDKPENPRESGPQPICHCADPELAKAYKKRRREIVQAHRQASIAFREGHFYHPFPPGTFRPVITKLLRPIPPLHTVISYLQSELKQPP